MESKEVPQSDENKRPKFHVRRKAVYLVLKAHGCNRPLEMTSTGRICRLNAQFAGFGGLSQKSPAWR